MPLAGREAARHALADLFGELSGRWLHGADVAQAVHLARHRVEGGENFRGRPLGPNDLAHLIEQPA